MQLHDYQLHLINQICALKRLMLCVPMGLGKTVSTASALDVLSKAREKVFPVLIVAPRRVAQTTWPDEIQKWPHLNHLSVSVIIGSAAQRKKAVDTEADIYTINYENLPWLVEYLDKKIPYRVIIADECSKLKGFRTRQGTKRARALATIAHKVPRYIGLTGTPAANGLLDIWPLLWFVDGGKRLGKTFTNFRNRWFDAIQIGHVPQAVRYEPRHYAQKEIEAAIKDVCISLDVKDHFNLDDPIVNVLKVTMPPSVRSHYREMEREMYSTLCDVEAANAASKTVKCLQIANGFLYTDDGYEVLHDLKLEALESIVEEASGAPILVAYNFKADLERILRRFPEAKYLDSNPETIAAWNRGEIPMLVMHPKAAGHGLSLQHGGSTIVFFGLDWALEERLQAIERIGPVRQKQSGYDRPVYIHYIVADGTIDEVVLARVDSKKTVLDSLMEALK